VVIKGAVEMTQDMSYDQIRCIINEYAARGHELSSDLRELLRFAQDESLGEDQRREIFLLIINWWNSWRLGLKMPQWKLLSSEHKKEGQVIDLPPRERVKTKVVIPGATEMSSDMSDSDVFFIINGFKTTSGQDLPPDLQRLLLMAKDETLDEESRRRIIQLIIEWWNSWRLGLKLPTWEITPATTRTTFVRQVKMEAVPLTANLAPSPAELPDDMTLDEMCEVIQEFKTEHSAVFPEDVQIMLLRAKESSPGDRAGLLQQINDWWNGWRKTVTVREEKVIHIQPQELSSRLSQQELFFIIDGFWTQSGAEAPEELNQMLNRLRSEDLDENERQQLILRIIQWWNNWRLSFIGTQQRIVTTQDIRTIRDTEPKEDATLVEIHSAEFVSIEESAEVTAVSAWWQFSLLLSFLVNGPCPFINLLFPFCRALFTFEMQLLT
jgi:hypothetical protein